MRKWSSSGESKDRLERRKSDFHSKLSALALNFSSSLTILFLKLGDLEASRHN